MPPLEKINDAKIWRVVNRRAERHQENGRKFVRLDHGSGGGAAWLVGSDFNEGTSCSFSSMPCPPAIALAVPSKTGKLGPLKWL